MPDHDLHLDADDLAALDRLTRRSTDSVGDAATFLFGPLAEDQLDDAELEDEIGLLDNLPWLSPETVTRRLLKAIARSGSPRPDDAISTSRWRQRRKRRRKDEVGTNASWTLSTPIQEPAAALASTGATPTPATAGSETL